MKARALACVAKNHVEILDIELPDSLQPGEVLVEKSHACISPGTDLRCLSLQEQTQETPFIMGYSSTGTVSAVGAGVELPIGTRVFAGGSKHLPIAASWGAYTSHGIHNASDLVIAPAAVAPRAVAATQIAAIAYHGLRVAKPLPHEKVAVVGLGVIGQLAARCYHLAGCHIVAADPNPARAARAAAVGITVAEQPQEGLQQAFAAHFPHGADLVVDCTGAVPVLKQAAGLAGDKPWDDSFTPAPRLMLQGSYAGEAQIDYMSLFLREMPLLVPRNCETLDKHAVLDFMARGLLPVEDLLKEVRIDAAQATFEALGQRDVDFLTATLAW